ncbi:MAG: redoxin domain-containing protein [Bacteroidia bacterium]|nr:redoxin domain-containing protein [Bacteroidia bacterium]
MFKWVVFWMTNWSETNKVMGFDAVFVGIVNKFYRSGKVDFYTKDQLKKIIDRADILEPLLIGHVVPELLCVDTNGIKVVRKAGIDTCKTSGGLTQTYLKNKEVIDKQLISLHAVKADYTVLVFWDVDCGHCKKEIPVLLEKLKELRKEGVKIKVHAVYTQHEYDKWLKTIKEMNLIDPDWTNVVDGVHLQNLKEKFDIFSTPVIYILDKSKTIRYKRIAADQLMDVMHNLIKNPGK